MPASDPDFGTSLYSGLWFSLVTNFRIAGQDAFVITSYDTCLLSIVSGVPVRACNECVQIDYEDVLLMSVTLMVSDSSDFSVGLTSTSTVSVQVNDTNDISIFSVVSESGSNSEPAVNLATSGFEPFLVVGTPTGYVPSCPQVFAPSD